MECLIYYYKNSSQPSFDFPHLNGADVFLLEQMGRNPIQTAGCYGILKSIQGNPESAMETLDFSVREICSPL